MPIGDKTGPNGQGPMTGRKLGFCTGNTQAGYVSDSPRRGMGRGISRGIFSGMGFRRGMNAGRGNGAGRGFARNGGFFFNNTQQMSNEEELEMLKKNLSDIESRIKDLEK